jgi:8-oxo-dGTP pyrophosphatase MutT (NUDIX family)
MQPPVKHRSAGIVVVRAEPDGWKFLVLRAYRYWDFPKGLIEPGESPLAAARRETAEETGLAELEFRWGHDSIDTEPYGDRKVATYFLAATGRSAVTLPINPELGRPEHDEFRWVGHAEAQRLLPPRLQPILAWAWRRITGSAGAA